MVTFTSSTPNVEELAPLIGKTVVITVKSSIDADEVAVGTVASFSWPKPELAVEGRGGALTFIGGATVTWVRNQEVTIEPIGEPAETSADVIAAVDGSESGSDHLTTILYTRLIHGALEVSHDPNMRWVGGLFPVGDSDPLTAAGCIGALSIFLSRELDTDDIVGRGYQFGGDGSQWHVWDVAAGIDAATATAMKPHASKRTITLHTQRTGNGVVIAEAQTGDSRTAFPGDVQEAFAAHLGQPITLADIEHDGYYAGWDVWHVHA